MRLLYLPAVLFFFALNALFAQTPAAVDENQYRLLIRHVPSQEAPIKLDGRLDEPAWQAAQEIGDFHQIFPFDTSRAVLPTRVRVTFDDTYLYVGFMVTQPRSTYITRSLKRDFEGGTSDVITVNIDPFKDRLNGFHFAVSPYGVQREGLLANGSDLSLDWDNRWFVEVANHPDHWVAEIAIPFKTLRYKRVEGENSWRINFGRNSMQQNEISAWFPVPRQFRPSSVAFGGQLIWADAPPRPGANVSVIPYLSARSTRDFELRTPTDRGAAVGADAKIAITPSLNLDLTVNPDFSQVEVDRQVTNLNRFELFFPERRQFFLENNDLFGTFGFPNSRPFFSRRVGLARGRVTRLTDTGDTLRFSTNVTVPICYGARLSGRLDKNWRIGLLNMQTAAVDEIGLPAANYSVGIVQRKLFSRSTIGVVFVDKENALGGLAPDVAAGYNRYNRVAGLEYNLNSKDNRWEGEFYYHRSYSPDPAAKQDAQSGAAFMGYRDQYWSIQLGGQYIGQGYRAEVGYVPRVGVVNAFPQVQRTWNPKNPRLARRIIGWGFGSENELSWNLPTYQLTDRSTNLFGFINFRNQSELAAGAFNRYTYLFFPFDPTNTGGLALAEGTAFTNSGYFANYQTDRRKDLTATTQLEGGQYFNGSAVSVSGNVSYRYQPYGIFAVSYTYNAIRLPAPYATANLLLVGPRAELSFSRQLFFSTFIQYNTQANNVNINSRLQWRFRPVSDLFLVYTDNYFSDQLFRNPQVKNRALVLKISYWLNA
jgi:hypothetical protein